MSAPAENQRDAQLVYASGYCVHGTAPYMHCLKCEAHRATMRREDALYATLDRLAAAMDRLGASLERSGEARNQ